MSTAAIVAIASGLTALCAICAFGCFSALREARSLRAAMRSQASTLSELAEIRDYMAKIDAWAKRINAREVMAARRLPPAASDDLGAVTDKAELRRRVGLVPGKPAPHRG